MKLHPIENFDFIVGYNRMVFFPDSVQVLWFLGLQRLHVYPMYGQRWDGLFCFGGGGIRGFLLVIHHIGMMGTIRT